MWLKNCAGVELFERQLFIWNICFLIIFRLKDKLKYFLINFLTQLVLQTSFSSFTMALLVNFLLAVTINTLAWNEIKTTSIFLPQTESVLFLRLSEHDSPLGKNIRLELSRRYPV